MRVLRDVEIQYDEFSGELAILSETPGVVGEEMTLAVVSAQGEVELRVQIVASGPQIVGDVLRHRLQLRPIEDEEATVGSGSEGSSAL